MTLGQLKTVPLLEEEDCDDRKERFTTFERVQFQELTVIKGNGKREPFDRDKFQNRLGLLLEKDSDSETIEKFISKIVRNLEGLGERNTNTYDR